MPTYTLIDPLTVDTLDREAILRYREAIRALLNADFCPIGGHRWRMVVAKFGRGSPDQRTGYCTHDSVDFKWNAYTGLGGPCAPGNVGHWTWERWAATSG